MSNDTYSRVAVTDAAAALLRDLTAQHGPLMFHQSGGCCDGSAPMCYPVGMFLTGPADVKLGDLDVGLDDAIEVFISLAQFEYWKYTHITIDAVPGRGAGFSVEGPTGMRFIIRSRMLDDAELAAFGLVPVTAVDDIVAAPRTSPALGSPSPDQS
ncbi:DUF779 domain-containing protein [Microbacterium sp. NE2HP2]|uniref:DUF779 domain-containing protein n=1 Tax=Microbacterium TaxID=33882 RepID=UPI0023657B0A|nr:MULTISPECIES: DUF779 domain-containing protein [Microbacterium]MDD7945424.1 DUF779 domain-containing protein [Microbacterium plantarum]WHE36130.1 DUF779 domain-containing protein [Microbacterium sp. BDGP8]